MLVLAWGLVYQQVENLTIEPRISAKAVDVHPAVSFASVMLGAALFGAAGAILAMICDTMIPEAFRKAQTLTGLVTVLGFVASYAVHQVG